MTDCVAGVERIFLLGEYGIVSERKVWDNRSYEGAPFWWDLHPTLRPSSLKIPSFLHHFYHHSSVHLPAGGKGS